MKKKESWIILFILLIIIPLWACSHKNKDSIQKDKNEQGDMLSVNDCKKCIVFTERADPGKMRVAGITIVDVERGREILWEWRPKLSFSDSKTIKWFNHIDEAKPVYNRRYILTTSSTGGVALIRIADKKVVWYAHPGTNAHSAEILPDGNIVVALSSPNKLKLYHTDTSTAFDAYAKNEIMVSKAHNVVWDKKRQLLWATGDDKLYSFQYNFDCTNPDLIPKDTVSLPGGIAHDLFPVYGKDALWLTISKGMYVVDLSTMDISRVQTSYQNGIKSVSSGPKNWSTIIQKPTTSYWSNQIIDLEGHVVASFPYKEIYKARWFLPNSFSYDGKSKLKICDK